VTPGHLVLVGPTASGKSALAFEAARRLGDVELVSVDSMQVYRGMDIGTAKPTGEERDAVPHHLLDLADPVEDFSVARFQRAATEAIADIEARGRRALLVGGTGLYLRAVVDRLTMPGEYPDARADLEREGDTAALYDRLARLDPVAASRIEPANRRRIVRALEVTVGSGRPFSSYGPGLGAHPPTRFRMVGVWLPRAVVSRRIVDRFHEHLAAGLVEEARRLDEQPLSRTARQALGYKEVLGHLSGWCTLDEAASVAIRRTVALARRQRVWFRRDPRITWLPNGGNSSELVRSVLARWQPTARAVPAS